jgi:hypothetical protein
MGLAESPFDAFDLDPSEGIQALTARLREPLSEAPASDQERIRAAWHEFTQHPARRAELALLAFPDARPPLGLAPVVRPLRADREPWGLVDLVCVPSLMDALPRLEALPIPPAHADDALAEALDGA